MELNKSNVSARFWADDLEVLVELDFNDQRIYLSGPGIVDNQGLRGEIDKAFSTEWQPDTVRHLFGVEQLCVPEWYKACEPIKPGNGWASTAHAIRALSSISNGQLDILDPLGWP